MKVAIYIRTSTEDQDPHNQLKDCVSINKYGDYLLFEDKQSAWKDNKEREGFEKLRKLIKQKKINNLIIWDFDRIYRKRKSFIEFMKFLKIYNCNLHSFRQQWLEEIYNVPPPWNEIVSDMLLQVMGWMAEEEANKLSQRIKIAYNNRKKKWGRKPINKKTEEEVIHLFKQGKSMRDISKEVYYWDESRNKHQVSKSAVHKIIKNYSLKNS